MRRQSFELLDGLMRNNSVSNKSMDNIYYIIAEPYSEDLGASGYGWILHSQLTGKPINSVPMTAVEEYTPSGFKEVFGISADYFMKNIDKIIIYFTDGEGNYTNIKSIPKDGFVS
jgi:hypothetical protein